MKFKVLLIAFLLACTCGGGCAHAAPVPVLQAAPPAVSAPYVVDIVGDNRNTSPWGLKFETYGKLCAMIAADKPAFTLNVGDYTLAASDKEWAAFVAASKAIADACPYFLCIGNHEVRSAAMEATYLSRTKMPGNGKYYSFTAGPALFVVLDSEEPGYGGKIYGPQCAWLRDTLCGSKAKFKFVFLHRPLYPDEDGEHSLDSMKSDSAKMLQSLFKQTGVGGVFVGHCHLYSRKVIDGIQHVITGGGGAPIRVPEKDGGFYEYVRGKVSADAASFEVIDINGKLRDSFQVIGR